MLNPCADYKLKARIRCLRPFWPALSPDLSPIENVWRLLKQRVVLWECITVEDLHEAIQAEWDLITIEEINKIHSTWHKRILQCHERKGNVTEW